MATAKPPTKRTKTAAAAAHTFRGLRDWIEVFKVGTHTDSKGRTATFSAADLDQMAANVAGSGVPHVIGHPKHDDPAYAWTKPGDLKRDGDSLLSRATDINSEFESAVDSGAWRERSVSIYRDPNRGWVVRHIGWLGAMEPGVTGLQPLQYTADLPDGAELFEFSAEAPAWDTGFALSQIGTVFRALRDWLIGKEGLEVADRLVPDWTLSTLADTARRITETTTEPEAQATGMFNRGTTQMPKIYTEEELQAARTSAAAEAAATVQLQFAAQGAELAELRAMRQREVHSRQVQDWQAIGLVTPARAVGMVEFMAALEAGGEGGEFSFSAADKSEAKKTPIEWFREFMAGGKAVKLGKTVIDPKHDATPLDTSDFQAIADAATEFVQAEAKAGRTVSSAEAVAHVKRQAGADQA